MFTHLLSFLIINSATAYLVDYLLESFTITGNLGAYILMGAIIGILNTFIRPILTLISLPILFITAGLFSIIINTGILYLATQIVQVLELEGITFAIQGFSAYIMSAIIIGFCNYLFHKIIK